MFSGCKDEQTSADAFIAGKHVGAMSWSFLETMRTDRNWDMNYIQVCGIWIQNLKYENSANEMCRS
jgi:hypothetical protein